MYCGRKGVEYWCVIYQARWPPQVVNSQTDDYADDG